MGKMLTGLTSLLCALCLRAMVPRAELERLEVEQIARVRNLSLRISSFAWKRRSVNFVLTQFSEVRIVRFLRTSDVRLSGKFDILGDEVGIRCPP